MNEMIAGAIGGFGNKLLDFGMNQIENKINAERYYDIEERAANQAYLRNINYYENFLSPQAKVKQLIEAGLSPALAFSNGISGSSGMSQPQGGGAPQPSQSQYNFDMLNAELIKSMVKKTEAEANNINEDTNNKQLQSFGIEYENSLKEIQLTIQSSTIDDQIKTITEFAKQQEEKAKQEEINTEILKETKQTQINTAKEELKKITSELNLNEKNLDLINSQIDAINQENLGYFRNMLADALKKIPFINEEKANNLAGALVTILRLILITTIDKM